MTQATEPRHVIVSGASRGLGQALARALLGAGYRVSTFSRGPTDFTRELESRPDAYYACCDAADAGGLERFVQRAETRLGTPYGLVNCAGVARDGVLATMPPGQIDELVRINLAGALHLTRIVARRLLIARRGGAVLNISSIVGRRGYSGLSAYAATKAGMDGMTRALARELGERGVRVNSLAPGYLETDMTTALDDRQRMQIVRRTPLGRLGCAADVSGAALFLLSDAAAFITGQVLVVDGGLTA